jgi:hypothetical protein
MRLEPGASAEAAFTDTSAREEDLLLAHGTLPAAIVVGAGLALAVIGLGIASIWPWIAR